MMFGVATKRCRLHAESFVNLIGEDEHGWGLSHKGLLWHGGKWIAFTKPFSENQATTIGLLFDSLQGTLTYYRDGVSLGIAFTGLDKITSKLYPMVSSTAAKTEMTLQNQRRDFFSLQDRCRDAIVSSLPNPSDGESPSDLVKHLNLPVSLERFLSQENNHTVSSDTDDSDQEMSTSNENAGTQVQWPNISDSVCGAFNRNTNIMSELPPFPQF